MIVVIRKNGDVEWTKRFSNILILNIGEPLTQEYHHMENTRTAHLAMFKYIYDNYENLDDYVIFVTVDEDKFSKICNNMVDRIAYYINNGTPPMFEFITHEKLFVNTYKIITDDEQETQLIEQVQNAYKEIFFKLFNRIEYKIVNKCDGLSFIVSKNLILARKKDFYFKIMEILENGNGVVEEMVIDVIIPKIFTNRFIQFEPTYTENYE
jgi:hypothetical protein